MISKKIRTTLVALAFGLPVSSALAADLDNLSGQSCGTLSGTWHFVNNQTRGAGPGTLVAVFESGVCVVSASAVNRNTQHFYCTGYSGALLDAQTDLPGRLVLSDFSCDEPHHEDPPTEEPPTDEPHDPAAD
jgi:hypothetical protein